MISKPIEHTLDIYGVQLHLATNRRQWATLRRRFDFLDTSTPTDCYGHTTYAAKHETGERHLVFWIDPDRPPAEVVDTCAHEAAHGTGRVLASIGHTYDETDEPSAWLTGWLAAWLWQGATT